MEAVGATFYNIQSKVYFAIRKQDHGSKIPLFFIGKDRRSRKTRVSYKGAVGKGEQEGLQIGQFTRCQPYSIGSDMVHQRADVRRIYQSSIVKLQYIVQGCEPAIVHVRRSVCKVSQGRSLVGANVSLIACDGITVARIGKNRISAIVVKQVGGEQWVAIAPVTVKTIAALFSHKKDVSISFRRC